MPVRTFAKKNKFVSNGDMVSQLQGTNKEASFRPPTFQLQGAENETLVNNTSTSPIGVCTEFGNFTIYPDNFVGPLPISARHSESWPIRSTAYNNLITQLTSAKNGSGNITIEGTTEFKTATYLDLGWLMTSGAGQLLISEIQRAEHCLNIIATSGGNATRYTPNADSYESETTPVTAGAGADVTVKYNPNKLQIGDGSEDYMTRPPAIGLAHELVHAWTGLYGTRARGYTDGVKRRELQATGLGEFENARITENRFRAEFGLPTRPNY